MVQMRSFRCQEVVCLRTLSKLSRARCLERGAVGPPQELAAEGVKSVRAVKPSAGDIIS